MITHNQNRMLRGILLAFLVASISITAVSMPDILDRSIDDQRQESPVPFSWDTSSGITLSSQMTQRAGSLLYVSVHASNITVVNVEQTCSPDPCEGDVISWTGTSYPLFNDGRHEVYSLFSFYHPNLDHWELRYSRISDIQAEPRFVIDPVVLNPLHTALEQDLEAAMQLQEIAEENLSLEMEYIEDGMLHLHITHFYEDGSIVSFESIGEKIFLRFERFSEYVVTDTIIGVHVDHDYKEVWYKGTIHGLGNYTAAINGILQSI